MSGKNQQEVFDFLADPATHGGKEVKRLRTHVAEVFLVGDCAYKVKRAVCYAFLDFSTLDARRRACEAEVRLNRRTAPDIYLGLSVIRRKAAGELELDHRGNGAGEPLEWAVRMRRFDESQTLDLLADEGRLVAPLIDSLVDAIVGLHEEAEVRGQPYGGAEGLRAIVEENRADMTRFPVVFSPDRLASLISVQQKALSQNAALLDARREAGFVRRCHGDLHLGNVVLWQEKPTPFDCIEFSESIGTIDVAYDLSFLLMDLEVRGLRALANRAMGRYFGRMSHPEILSALPLMLALRASVRAKVSAMTAEGASDERARQRALKAAHSFFAAAEAFMSDASAPRLIVVGGLSGSGKTTLAAALAPDVGRVPGALHLRSDIVRKRLAGVAPEERLPVEAYDKGSSRRVYETLFREAHAALKAGQVVVLDAVFARPDERAEAEALARDTQVRFDGLWLDAPADALKARVSARKGDASDATAQVVEQQLTYAIGEIAWPRIDATQREESVMQEAQGYLKLA